MIISMWLVSASIEGPSVSKQTTLIYAFGIMIFLNSKTTWHPYIKNYASKEVRKHPQSVYFIDPSTLNLGMVTETQITYRTQDHRANDRSVTPTSLRVRIMRIRWYNLNLMWLKS